MTPLPFRMHSLAAALLCLAASTAFSAQPVAAPAAPNKAMKLPTP